MPAAPGSRCPPMRRRKPPSWQHFGPSARRRGRMAAASTGWPGTDTGGRGAAGSRGSIRPTGRAAEARLALRRDDAAALALVPALPAAAAGDAGAAAGAGPLPAPRRAATPTRWRCGCHAAPPPSAPRRPSICAAFWDERNILARHRLRDGDAAGRLRACRSATAQTGDRAARRCRVPGRLHRAAQAERPGSARHRHFQRARRRVEGRDHPGPRALLAGPCRRAHADAATATREYAAAAAWPNTFYGQLAALALGEGPAGWPRASRALRDPARRRAPGAGSSPGANWRAPPPTWSPGASRAAPRRSCCGWTTCARPGRPRDGRAPRRRASACRRPRSPSPAAPGARA